VSSKKIVLDSLEFNNPTRIPRQLWTLPWAEKKYPDKLKNIQNEFPNDILLVNPYYKENLNTEGDLYKKGTYVDEWGCKFVNLKEGIHGEVKDPLIKKWNEVHKVNIPLERLTINKQRINKFCNNTNKFTLPEVSQRPFERLQFIRGTENLFIDLIEQPSELKYLLDEIHNFYKKEVALWCETDVDGIFFMDDWGAQNNLLINPKLWRKLFKPLYKEYIEIAHNNSKYAFMHSDGYITNIIPDLVEIGLDALNSQLFCMDIKELGKKHKGKITFWGEIDRQQLLSFGSENDIKKAVNKVYENLFSNGGIIAQCEFGPGAKPENVKQVFKSWNKF